MREFTVIRSRRRTMALQVTREGQEVVRAPIYAARGDIHRFVTWIAAQQARQSQRLAEHPPLSREEQEALRQRARQVLPPMVKLWAQRMGGTPTGVKITAAQTRFGSCSGKDSLCFSLHLMEYPLEAAEAVVVHELAHIRHKNHGPDFYALVRRTLPDYDSRIKLLK